MKQIFYIMLMCVAMSCSDDKDTYFVIKNQGRQVAGIIDISPIRNKDYYFKYNEDGSMKEIIRIRYNRNNLKHSEDTCRYERSGNTLIVSYVDPYTYTIGDDGRLTQGSYNSGHIENYTYKDGYIIDDGETSLIWSDGDLIKKQSSEDGEDIADFTYTNYENKTNVDIAEILALGYMNCSIHCVMTAGYLGNKSRHLIDKNIRYGSRERSDFSYEFDANGYVTKIIKVEHREFNPATHTYKITYVD